MLSVLPAAVPAGEEADRLCSEATKSMLIEHGAPGDVDPSPLCFNTPHTAEYWGCVLDKMRGGEGYATAASSPDCGYNMQQGG